MRKKVVNIRIEVKYPSYDTKEKNSRADRDIKKWIRESFEDFGVIPLYIEKDSYGSDIEDLTRPCKITFR